MSKKKIQLSIPEPCDKIFSKMNPAIRGNFCKNCEKVIVDFTKMSDKEIANFYLKNEGKTCGQFRKDQLNRNIYITPTTTNSYRGKVASILLSSVIATGISTAQNNTSLLAPNRNQHLAELIVNNHKNKIETNSVPNQSKKTIKLTVTDENREPLIGASVAFKNYKKHGTSTDIDGTANIDIPVAITEKEVIIIIISYTGYSSSELTVNRDEFNLDKVNTVILSESFLLGYTIVTEYGYPKPKTLYQVVKNWFYNLKYNREGRMNNREERREKRAERKQERIAKKDKKIKNDSANKIIQLPIQHFSISLNKIFPNPFSHDVNLEVSSEKKGDIQISLFDISGKKIYQITQGLIEGTQNIKLNLKNLILENGEYILQLKEKSGKVQSRKLIKIAKGNFKLNN